MKFILPFIPAFIVYLSVKGCSSVRQWKSSHNLVKYKGAVLLGNFVQATKKIILKNNEVSVANQMFSNNLETPKLVSLFIVSYRAASTYNFNNKKSLIYPFYN
ncbi:hypothetical protein VNO77_00419 [Canavalia gladiata]|uniref:Lipoprotein n=1 Tax=Canavalia gladiata TaxID=3824 RepID=A0AAN9R4D4_CANGL